VQSSKGYHRLAQAHIQEQRRDRMPLDILDTITLVFMRFKEQTSSPPIILFCSA
jgi:hypothetical protein